MINELEFEVMKKQVYIQPVVDVMNVSLSTPILVGSGGNINNSGGSGIDPD